MRMRIFLTTSSQTIYLPYIEIYKKARLRDTLCLKMVVVALT
ncbi:hypothetical protein GME_04442 [Halomonas sp. TD01]|nr:hypothetical protein GME_04442 [Halomonas sp. TD01]